MRDEILSYHELVGREKANLQRGMNFRINPKYSILLMSTRSNAPYEDRWDQNKDLLIYQGHDIPKTKGIDDPKKLDQPLYFPSGKLTQNGKFLEAAKLAASGKQKPELIRVYEKLDKGVWSDKGMFLLVDGKYINRNGRMVVELYLKPIETDSPINEQEAPLPHTRLIPTSVKVEVWKRDRGRCVICGSTENLHYDHDLPFSKGGSSLTANNVRILCAKHNLSKHDKIE